MVECALDVPGFKKKVETIHRKTELQIYQQNLCVYLRGRKDIRILHGNIKTTFAQFKTPVALQDSFTIAA